MGTNENLLRLLSVAWRIDLSSWFGFASASVLNFVLVIVVVAGLGEAKFTVKPPYWGIVLLAIELCIAGVFLFLRYIRVMDPKVISIGFAVAADTDSAKFYREIQAVFRRHINAQGLVGIVHVRQLPSDLHFKTNKEAEEYALSKGLRVLVWGDTTRVTVGSENMSVFNISISYQHDKRDDGLLSDMGAGVHRGVWAIRDTESYGGLAVVGGNITEISLYALGRCLISTRQVENVERGVGVLESLQEALAGRMQDMNFPGLGEVQQNVKTLLLREYYALAVYYYQTVKDTGRAKRWTERALGTDPNDYAANIFMARICWQLEDRQGARLHTERARSARPEGSLPRLNLAFFDFLNGKYGKGLNHYKKLKWDVMEGNTIETVEFIQTEYDKTKKPALLFAAGWLSHHFGDGVLGKNLLEQFCTEVGIQQEFRRLRLEAEKILEI